MKIIITDKIYLNDSQREKLQQLGEVQLFQDVVSGEQLTTRLNSADIAVINFTRLPACILNTLDRLRMIAIYATGYDSVDMQTAERKNIIVSNVPHYASASTAELAFGLILSVSRKIFEAQRIVKSGKWHRPQEMGVTLHGKTLGIIGMGGIGQALAHIGNGFGMNVIAATKHPSKERANRLDVQFFPMYDILEQSDIVILSLPLDRSTRHLIGEDEFHNMQSHALLVNVSRGELVDEHALLKAVETGRIQGGCLDVVSNECKPEIFQKMNLHPNIFITPHIGYYTLEAAELCANITLRNIEMFVKGTPGNVVNNKK